MIEADKLTKCFDGITALDRITTEIKAADIFGLIGSNGAGKSTFLRMLAGVLRPDGGTLKIDGGDIFENTAVKGRCFFISDEQFCFANSTPDEMKNYYKIFYRSFDSARYKRLMSSFGISERYKLRTFSKGMRKQVMLILGLAANTDYLFCDETFDGLDPVARQAVKSLFAEGVETRGLTAVIASHSLREIEDICGHIGLLHRGGILFSRDIDEMKLDIYKLQAVFERPLTEEELESIEAIHIDRRGSLYSITARGSRESIEARVEALHPTFFELLPLSLEEIFINETGVAGYDIKSLLF